MTQINEKLKKYSPCRQAVLWMNKQESPEKAWETCERGDWMLWIAKRLGVDDRKLTMAKAMCAKQVEHLMQDKRSKDAIQACVDYYNGKISREELNAAAAVASRLLVAAVASRHKSLKKSADICREYLTEEVLTKYNEL